MDANTRFIITMLSVAASASVLALPPMAELIGPAQPIAPAYQAANNRVDLATFKRLHNEVHPSAANVSISPVARLGADQDWDSAEPVFIWPAALSAAADYPKPPQRIQRRGREQSNTLPRQRHLRGQRAWLPLKQP